MPYTQKTGRYYKIVNGKRQYDPRFDKKPAGGPRSVALTGRGAYKTKKAKGPPRQPRAHRAEASQAPSRLMLEAGGALLGGTLFGPAGAAVGGMAGGALGSFLGLGDYEIKENVFMGGRLPVMINDTPSGGTIIRHQEFLGDILTASTPNTFNIQSFALNPAAEGTHPWLAQIAANYEEYEYEGLVFQFRSTSADALNSTNTALGTVIMATNYDAADPLFASKAEMLNYEFSCSTKPSESLLHMVECAPSQTVLGHRYTRPGLPPAGTDIRFFDLGNFQIATTGFQGTSVNIGELHCTYQVRLLKPKLFVALGSDINYSRTTNNIGVAAVQPLGTAGTQTGTDNIGLTFTATTVTFPPSRIIERYWVTYFVGGTVAAAIVNPIVTLTNATGDPLIGMTSPINTTLSTTMMSEFEVRTLGDGSRPVISFGTVGTLPAGTVTRILKVQQAPNDLV